MDHNLFRNGRSTKKQARFSFTASMGRGDTFKVISAAWFSFRTQTRTYEGTRNFAGALTRAGEMGGIGLMSKSEIDV